MKNSRGSSVKISLVRIGDDIGKKKKTWYFFVCAILQQPAFLLTNNAALPQAGSKILHTLIGLHLGGPIQYDMMNGKLLGDVRCSGNTNSTPSQRFKCDESTALGMCLWCGYVFLETVLRGIEES